MAEQHTEKHAVPLRYYRVCAGHCDGGAYVQVHNGRAYRFPDGLIVRASANCDPDGDVANLASNPPLVRTWVIDHAPDIFQPLNNEE